MTSIAHLTTVDLSLRYLLLPQLEEPLLVGIESLGISAPGPWIGELEERGIRHLALPTSTRGMSVAGDLRAALDLLGHLRRHRPSVLHTHNPKPGLYGRVVGRLARVPIVVNTVHGLYAAPDDRLLKRLVVYLLEAIAARFSDAELVQSREDAEIMKKLRIAPSDKVIHLGNGIDLTRFSPTIRSGARSEVRRELGVADSDIVVGVVGRLVVEKGYRELFRAARALGDGFRFVCIGPDDPDKDDALAPEEIRSAGNDGVVFLGMRTDVERLYAGMDIFVLPSHREGFPRAAMEAAASGLPVVATDIRGCREVVEDEVTGLLVPVGDARALAAAVRALSDPSERKRMGRAGRVKAENEFDERRIVETVMRTYLRLARVKGEMELVQSLSRLLESGEVQIVVATENHVGFLADMHGASIGTGFLPKLGNDFMRVLYRQLVGDSQSLVLVAEDATGPVGFVAGTRSTSEFYRRFARRAGLRAGMAAGWRLARPSFLRRAVESFRYGIDDSSAGAELLSMAVVPDRRGRGIATRLGEEFLGGIGSDSIRVVVGSANLAALASYRKMGFVPHDRIEIHRGDRSEILQWSRS